MKTTPFDTFVRKAEFCIAEFQRKKNDGISINDAKNFRETFEKLIEEIEVYGTDTNVEYETLKENLIKQLRYIVGFMQLAAGNPNLW